MPVTLINTLAYDKIRAVEWENGRLKLIDQRILPGKFEYLYLDHLPESAKAITDMVVRGGAGDRRDGGLCGGAGGARPL
jgi:hypothetical protein